MGMSVNGTFKVARASKSKLWQTGLLLEEVVMGAIGTICHTWDSVVHLTTAILAHLEAR